MKFFFTIIVVSFLITNFSHSMTQNQMMIIQQTLNVDQGTVTKQWNPDFWKDIPN